MSGKLVASRKLKSAASIAALVAAGSIAVSAEAQTTVFLNEIHYDNDGGDTGEFFEIAGPQGTDLSGWSVVLYNGTDSQRAPYDSVALTGTIADQDNGYGTLEFFRAGIQNGAPDGLALLDDTGSVVQFLSYEGSFEAADGPAAGMTSTDIGASEASSTPVGFSLQLSGTGFEFEHFSFDAPKAETPGLVNDGQAFDTPTTEPGTETFIFVNEFHYDNDGADTGEFVEIAGPAGTDLSGWELVLYNGTSSQRAPYDTITLGGTIPDLQGGVGTLAFAQSGIQNGAPDGFALVDSTGKVVQFLSYEGSFEAADGPAAGMTSMDVGVSESSSTAPGLSLQLAGSGVKFEDFIFEAPVAETPGAVNLNQSFDGTPPPPPPPPPPAPTVSISEIQGAGHISPFEGETVQTSGVVTAVASNGFYLQAPFADYDDATSEGLFVFTSSAPSVAVRDELSVTGTVVEFQPGGSGTGNLTLTELTDPTIAVTGQAFELPAPVLIGEGGRTPPTAIIDNDQFSVFDPDEDGIDFYESLEGMRVEIDAPVAVAPTNRFGEVFVRSSAPATGISPEGGLTISEDDFNPERIQVDDALFSGDMPAFNTGAALENVIGVVNYAFGNFEVLPDQTPVATSPASLEPEVSELEGTDDQITVASFNVENLSPQDDQEKFDALAKIIADKMHSPDIIGLQEVQDNNGDLNDGTVAASETYTQLVNAIAAAGGAGYAFTDIPPVDGQDGGQPGGNIRVGYLYRTDRVAFDAKPGSPTADTQIVSERDGPELSNNPGRIKPLDAAFENSRKPLAARFMFNDLPIFVINTHQSSRGGSDPLFGENQPPENRRDETRLAQALIVRDFVRQIQFEDENARIVVLGDFNAFQFEAALEALEDNGKLLNLTETLEEADQYSYIFQGNSQALDHVLVGGEIKEGAEYNVIRVNANFAEQVSDHDPMIARFEMDERTWDEWTPREKRRYIRQRIKWLFIKIRWWFRH